MEPERQMAADWDVRLDQRPKATQSAGALDDDDGAVFLPTFAGLGAT